MYGSRKNVERRLSRSFSAFSFLFKRGEGRKKGAREKRVVYFDWIPAKSNYIGTLISLGCGPAPVERRTLALVARRFAGALTRRGAVYFEEKDSAALLGIISPLMNDYIYTYTAMRKKLFKLCIEAW